MSVVDRLPLLNPRQLAALAALALVLVAAVGAAVGLAVYAMTPHGTTVRVVVCDQGATFCRYVQ